MKNNKLIDLIKDYKAEFSCLVVAKNEKGKELLEEIQQSINIGAAYFTLGERKIALDAYETGFYYDEESERVEIDCKLSADNDILGEDEVVDLLATDLFDPELQVTFYIGWETDDFGDLCNDNLEFRGMKVTLHFENNSIFEFHAEIAD